MTRTFIELQEAARLLNVTTDELADMRTRHKINGYRDGATWKFKTDEIKRVAGERGIDLTDAQLQGTADAGPGSDIDADLNLLTEVDESTADSVLLSDEELEKSGSGSSSTIIGASDEKGGDSDLQLTGDSGKGSDIQLGSDPTSGSGSGSGSDVQLVPDAGTDSDVKLVPGGSGSDVLSGSDVVGKQDGGTASGVDGSDAAVDLELDVDGGGSSGTSSPPGSSDVTLGEEDSSAVGSGGSLGTGSEVDLDFESDDDDDLVLGSDVTLGAGDSGIGLSSPSDSGLSLIEEPLDLSGSNPDASLELPEDVVSLDDATADPDAATQLKADDDFLLTPAEGSDGEESDSGSQVIALDTDENYDEEAVTLLGGGAEIAITEDDGGVVPIESGPVTTTILPPVQALEAPYTIWNVISLVFIAIFLGLTGMMMTDLIRQIWSWDQPFALNSDLMDWIVSMFEG